jgi:hypothetical protein
VNIELNKNKERIKLFLVDDGDKMDITCDLCDYFLGFANKNDLIPNGEIMFECPDCHNKWDISKK